MELSTRARRRIATALALVLAIESVSVVSVAAASVRSTAPDATAPATTFHALVGTGLPGRPRNPLATAEAAAVAPVLRVVAPTIPTASGGPTVAPAVPPAAPEPAKQPERHPQPDGFPTAVAARGAQAPAPAHPAAHPAAAARRTNASSGSTTSHRQGSTAPVYRGTNHVWIPALGISKSVQWFPCDRMRPPDNYMYRWGCAGANNVYLMGHAYSVMEPLHDAYVSGRLYKGMKAYYAGSNGVVHVYGIRWWKLTRPTTDAAWAWAAQDVPSMTLQTCVGADSQWRLMVRLTEVGG